LAKIHAEMQRRLAEHAVDAPGIYIVIYGLQRYRALRKSEDGLSFSMSDDEKPPQPTSSLPRILREGPPRASTSSPGATRPRRRSHARSLGDARIRQPNPLQMSAADSSNLIDSPAANQAGLLSRPGVQRRARRNGKVSSLRIADKTWLQHIRRNWRSAFG